MINYSLLEADGQSKVIWSNTKWEIIQGTKVLIGSQKNRRVAIDMSMHAIYPLYMRSTQAVAAAEETRMQAAV